ncbi:MAG: transcriptional regulator [Candidatus Nitrosocaldaceae archaeon]|nr:MAG: transcriptional regulator [Candidatus Nitrosocaldaceae archaeon]
MRRVRIIDSVDKEILRIIAKHPKINQVELASKMGLTQPAISLRLRKLRKMNVLNDENVIIDPSILGIRLLSIDIHAKNNSHMIEKARRCPMVIHCYAMEGNTLSLVAMGENKQFLNCMVSKHIESDAVEVNARNIIESIKGINTTVDLDQRLEEPPCGDPPCTECEYYIDNGGECVGCPLTIHYKGSLWNGV